MQARHTFVRLEGQLVSEGSRKVWQVTYHALLFGRVGLDVDDISDPVVNEEGRHACHPILCDRQGVSSRVESGVNAGNRGSVSWSDVMGYVV